MCGLGRSLSLTGRLNPAAVERALRALARFRILAEQCNVVACHPFATAAVRAAEDSESFITRAEEACGYPIRTVSARDECELARKGVLAGFTSADGVVGDLGGGSLELASVKDESGERMVSLPLGGLVLIDATGKDRKKATRLVEKTLDGIPWLGLERGRSFYAVGGTWRALARLHMTRIRHPISAVHGFSIDLEQALRLSSRFTAVSSGDLRKMAGMAIGREETLPFGAMLFNRLLQRIEPQQVIFSAFGVREGLLYSLLSEEEQKKDPLISACEEVARLRARSPEHAHELIRWTAPLFETPEFLESAEDARLRKAACLLSDIAWRAHPDYRGEQSASLIAQSALVGIDHPGRAFLALAVHFRYGRSVSGELLTALAGMIPEPALKRAKVIGFAVRLANDLSAGMPNVLPETPLNYEGGKLVLTLPEKFALLDGEAVHRRLRMLAELVGKSPEIRIAGTERTFRRVS